MYALAKAGSQAIGVRSVLEDLGVNLQVRFLTDATTGKAIAMRRGAGKLRHLGDHAALGSREHGKG